MRPRIAVAALSLVLGACTGEGLLTGPGVPTAGGPSFSHSPAEGDSPVVTELAWTGATAFTTDDATVTLGARLTWSGGGVAGATVRLTLYDGQAQQIGECVVPTDTNGNAQCGVPASLSVGYVYLSARYDGDAFHQGAMTTTRGTVTAPPPPPPPPPAAPTTADDCRNGGWMQYGVFRNQGDCVRYVATGGRNQPAEQ